MAGAELSAKAIQEILDANPQICSGFLEVNDKLEVVSRHFFNTRLSISAILSCINEDVYGHSTGCIFFDTFEGKVFISQSKFIVELNRICDSAGLTLIDFMLFGTDDWVSLRQNNRL